MSDNTSKRHTPLNFMVQHISPKESVVSNNKLTKSSAQLKITAVPAVCGSVCARVHSKKQNGSEKGDPPK